MASIATLVFSSGIPAGEFGTKFSTFHCLPFLTVIYVFSTLITCPVFGVQLSVEASVAITGVGLFAASGIPAGAYALWNQYSTTLGLLGFKTANQFYNWINMVGTPTAVKILKAAGARATDIGYSLTSRGLYYRPQIQTAINSVASFISHAPSGAIAPTNIYIDFILGTSSLISSGK